ncbi:isoflavone reductase family protein [Cryphonectria parasitica EP155]|uniref:Isoflavone reductase family protein n=1 Tax=Cryphonectria parasitica (strain ATCC 38755 / EP155) TaxID=660469 RepID=A0A9P5CNC5_CRYP1|nr:isoflavone reductase family protein [Cryphonectria parasitica EP155]KAF3765018.1 isoflavone reductase family protein [Cryphonectria parasitica EP155]
MSVIKVVVVGATGHTGKSIMEGLLNSPTNKFEVYCFTRPASVNKPENIELGRRGAKIVSISLTDPEETLVAALRGIQVVISCITPVFEDQEILLANASKRAGVERFFPSGFGPVVPPAGIMKAREEKERVNNHILKLHLGYTFLDVGTWYQASLLPVPSGRLDYCVPPAMKPTWPLGLDGKVPTAVTDLNDIGRYVALIIADPRTLNKKVLVYNQVVTRNEIYDGLERVSGEKLERVYISEAEALKNVDEAEKKFAKEQSIKNFFALGMYQYFLSWSIRADNTPEYAKYLGYLDGKELYPDFNYQTLEGYMKKAFKGEVEPTLMQY